MPKSSFGFDAPEESPGFMLWQTSVLWTRKIKQILTPYQVSHAQFVMLANLVWFEEKNIEPTQKQIVAMSKLDKMTVSSGLKKLAKDGLVTRAEDSEDTRVKLVHLTVKGRRLTKKMIPLIEKTDAHFFSGLTKEKQTSLVRLLHELAS